jgi:His/Glu/Gln/Arg/opine family amino acid ABC transporter permease subunit
VSFDYHVLVQYYPDLLDGWVMTLIIAVIAAVSGTVIGLIVCMVRLSGRRVLPRIAAAYTNVFRTIPEMSLIFWIYFCAPPLLDLRLSAFASGAATLSLVSGAYMAEIFRAGVLSLPKGQFEAAQALALPRLVRWRLVILPQAVRAMTPAFVTYLTELLKNTALLSAIGVAELAYAASTLGAQTFRYMEFMTAIALAFFAIIFPLSVLGRMARPGMARAPGPRPR